MFKKTGVFYSHEGFKASFKVSKVFSILAKQYISYTEIELCCENIIHLVRHAQKENSISILFPLLFMLDEPSFNCLPVFL